MLRRFPYEGTEYDRIYTPVRLTSTHFSVGHWLVMRRNLTLTGRITMRLPAFSNSVLPTFDQL